MCKACGKNSCSGGCDSSNSLASLASQVATLKGQVNTLISLTKFLNGHPVLWLDEVADIASFNLTTGIGSGNWVGWGICNGNTYQAIVTPDLRDRFLTCAGGNYNVDDTGGENFHILLLNELPVITFTVTDAGHTHDITDPGHTHDITDPGHTHGNSQGDGHQHSFSATTDPAGSHTHVYSKTHATDLQANSGAVLLAKTGGTGSQNIGDNSYDATATSSAGSHTHVVNGTTNMTTISITIESSETDITVDTAETGITIASAETGITIEDVGKGEQHENRPPYYAGLFVMKIS